MATSKTSSGKVSNSKKKFTRKDSAKVIHKRIATPNVPVKSGEHPVDVWGEGVRFSGREIALSELGGSKAIGVNISIVPPGKQSCPFHFHMLEEEHFYVLSGRVILRSGESRYEMREGDYACFPAGTRVAHAFENPFAEDCRVLVIGERKNEEVAVYPDSGKMKIRALGIMLPYVTEGMLGYWDGERADEPLETKKVESSRKKKR